MILIALVSSSAARAEGLYRSDATLKKLVSRQVRKDYHVRRLKKVEVDGDSSRYRGYIATMPDGSHVVGRVDRQRGSRERVTDHLGLGSDVIAP
jgi:hypothetical protein